MTEESQAPPETEAPEEVVEAPAETPVESPVEPVAAPEEITESVAEPEAIVDKESLHLERHAVARALDAATTTNVGDAVALQARYDELGAQLEALA